MPYGEPVMATGPTRNTASSTEASGPRERVELVRAPVAVPTVFRPVRAGNAYEETVEHLLEVIKLGAVSEGERLPPERDLATRLNVSRVTLREALRSLQQAGYIESRRGRSGGTFVTYRPSLERLDATRVAHRLGPELESALTFRYIVEPGAVEVAARTKLAPHQRDQLRDRLAEVLGASVAEYRQADSRLHLLIAELTGSAMVTRAVADIRVALNDLLSALPPLDRPLTRANRQHEEMVAAILAGNPRKARRAMEEHADATASLLRGFLT